MRKNRMMRLASVLLVCVLLTTSVISGTFAKYTTTSSVNDSARVAYWGFKQTSETEIALFDHGDDGIQKNGLLAPGSAKSVTFGFAYSDYDTEVQAPEVDYTFEIDVTTTGLAGGTSAIDVTELNSNPNFYWILDEVAYKNFDDFETAIEDLDGNVAKYEAGTLPEKFYTKDAEGKYVDGKTHTIGWQWFFGDETTSGLKDSTGHDITVNNNNDATDTAMGNDTDLNDLAIKITITATQVD